jgi:hypothetical protein
MREDEDPQQSTVGELRKRLADLGWPWRPHLGLTDNDPLPTHPRGGEYPEELKGAEVIEGKLDETLQQASPTNPYLQERWEETGLLRRSQTEEPRDDTARTEEDAPQDGG